jgi:archaemetzincin
MRQVDLVPLGAVDPSILQYLLLVLSEHAGLSCSLRPRWDLDPKESYLPERHQHNSARILQKLQELERPPGHLRLGITELDLCVPVLTFVFGEAHRGGTAGVVSLHRLHQSFYGHSEDPEILLRRAEKECLHELGHMAGLTHCERYECAMTFSNAVERVDIKEATFCPSCRETLLAAWSG